ncbi:hypothetical protein LTR72_000043 [Exophiala xenobiotica]|nr:hypothetical protein LTR72_000043 [Exophiala xenobiotica]KAK5277575.1 hypothetical protein LTR40_010227 [Exophiala xenobiotica]KAK5293048.1 hypothetical protein LTR14_005398 [Exophiala xenobiotica]KAK5322677.1 hypothetical protein LTR93_005881 [Exophiala xenobiotica]KAK5366559.1 hypothetical protein LTS13_008321 [Exophiala xenobiotica]
MALLRVIDLDAPSSASPAGGKAEVWKEIEEEDDNMLVKLQEEPLRKAFFDDLQSQIPNICGIVSHHLFLSRLQQCEVADRSEWLYGSFNTCIPINITNWRKQRLMLRCPFPFMLGGPDGLDEKIRCEAATFAWISENCPRLPIPHLWGFGLPNGTSFTPVAHLPWYRRIIESLKRSWAWLWRQSYSTPFVPRQAAFSLKSGYLLVDFVEEEQGIMLSRIWPPETVEQKRNLYRSLSRIMLDLARHPLPRIGSFMIHNSGKMSLSNRPLTKQLPLLESSGVPLSIPRGRTYSATDSYIRDLLDCHDMKLRHQPNAVRDDYDAEGQMAVLTILRAVPSHFTMDRLRHGPFCHIWTDCHKSNIFVNRRYDITCIPDLEWISVLPIEALSPPVWLSGYAVDEIQDEKQKNHHEEMCTEFLDIFGQEDNDQLSTLKPGFCTRTMKDALEKATHWFWAALNHPRVTYNLFLDHLQPRLAPTQLEGDDCIQFQQILAPYWAPNPSGFIDQKLADRQKYLEDLRAQHRHRYC